MFKVTPYRSNQVMRSRNDFFDSFVDDFFNDAFFTTPSISNGAFKVDIMDNDDTYVLEAELPGVAKENITIDYKNQQLTIKVAKEEEKEEENAKYVYKERRQKELQRVFRMKNVKGEEIKAKLENGILTVTVPKADEVVNSYNVEIQ